MGVLENIEQDLKDIKEKLEESLKNQSANLTNDEFSEYPLILNVEHIAKILDIGRVQAYQLVKRADFPKKNIGKRILIYKQAFIIWLSNNEGG